MNSVNLIGNLTKDWELKTTNSGKMVAENTLAVKKNKDSAIFIPVRAWSGTAALLTDYTEKGSKLGISGRLDISQYEDKEEITRYFTYVVVDEITFCDKKKGGKDDNY